MKYYFLVLLFVTVSISVSAKYQVTDNCQQAWMHLMNLDIEEAKSSVANELSSSPDNYYAYYLEQTCDAYALLINSEYADYESFLEKHEARRELMDEKDVDSPFYLACKAEMDLHVGIFNIVNGSRISGLRKAYSAYKKTYKNLEKFPNFNQSLKLDGFFNVAVFNLPPFVKFAVSAFGVSGDIDYGLKLLRDNYQTQRHIKGLNAEAAMFVILSEKMNKTPESVYDFTRSLDEDVSNTFIHTYFRANVAYRTGRNEEALQTLLLKENKKSSYGDVVYSYLMGKILLRKLDYNAGYYFDRYLSYSKKKEYVKEINYKLGLHYLINNNFSSFEKHKEIALNTGKDINERDRESYYDANLDYVPSPILTKARLLLDGGYYSRYSNAIIEYRYSGDEILPYNLEYHLLKGRYSEHLNDHENAIKYFKKVIDAGSDEDYYFAAEAALRLGFIYENTNQKSLAKIYYEKTLKLYDNDFYEYIEDKASKGLDRL